MITLYFSNVSYILIKQQVIDTLFKKVYGISCNKPIKAKCTRMDLVPCLILKFRNLLHDEEVEERLYLHV